MNDTAPKKEARIRCSSCGVESSFSESARQENLPAPHNSVLEILIICPHCGLRTHSYYISEETLKSQDTLKQILIVWNKRRTPMNYAMVKRIREECVKLFDGDQEEYRSIMEKVVAQDVTE